jgi:hypothetical protein
VKAMLKEKQSATALTTTLATSNKNIAEENCSRDSPSNFSGRVLGFDLYSRFRTSREQRLYSKLGIVITRKLCELNAQRQINCQRGPTSGLIQVVLEGVLDEDCVLDEMDSFLVSVFDSLVSLFASFVSLLDSEDDELAPFSPLEASLPLRA